MELTVVGTDINSFAGSEFLPRNAAKSYKNILRRMAYANCSGSCAVYRA